MSGYEITLSGCETVLNSMLVEADELSTALGGVLTGISGMDRAFGEGDQMMADETRATEGSTAFDAARFGVPR